MVFLLPRQIGKSPYLPENTREKPYEPMYQHSYVYPMPQSYFIILVLAMVVSPLLFPQYAVHAAVVLPVHSGEMREVKLTQAQGPYGVVFTAPHEVETPKPKWTIHMPITAYSSTLDQTDDTPFITASGTHVRDGIIAANFLPIGTVVKIPKLYGDKEFVVEDRMNKRYFYHADIWMETRREAVVFGLKFADVEVY